MNKETYFTDTEYRIILAMISHEEAICKKVDEQVDGPVCLMDVVNSIKKKLKAVQYGEQL